MMSNLTLPLHHSNRIAIVGKAQDSMLHAPFADPTWSIWIMNDMGLRHGVPRWDLCAELHDRPLAEHDAELLEWIRQQRNGLVLVDEVNLPAAIGDPNDAATVAAFPKRQMHGIYGNYFTSTVAWLIALAIAQKPSHLAIFGVNSASPAEYAHQRACIEHYLGIAKGAGILVTVATQSDLLQCRCPYGQNSLEQAALASKWTAHRADLERQLAEAEAAQVKAAQQSIFIRGALQECAYAARYLAPSSQPV